MRTAIDLKGISMRTARALTLAVLGLCAVAAAAHAAPAPAPSLKVLGVAAPTHLPPRQSEVQRVTVEAEGGSFGLFLKGAQGFATPVFLETQLGFTEGSSVATIESLSGSGKVEVGDRVALPETFTGSTILSCSADCETPGSTIELSEPAGATESAARQIFTRELTGVTGSFEVGQEITRAASAGFAYPYFEPGTVVTAVGPGTMTLSNPTTSEYASFEGALELTSGTTIPALAFDSSAEAVQSAIEAALGTGSATVTGGPGGTAEHPYYIEFGGPFANRDVTQLEADSSGLTGAHPFARVFTTIPGGVGTGEIVVLPANIGGAPTSGTVTVKVGPLPSGIVTSGPASGTSWICPGGQGDTTVTCTTTQEFRPIHSTPNTLSIPIEVGDGAAPSSSVAVEISGGGAAAPDTHQTPIVVSKQPAPFGVAAAWAGSFEADGSPSTQAGAHPFQSSAYIMLNTLRLPSGGVEPLAPVGDSREVLVDLPPGFVGNPLAGKRCPQSVLIPPSTGSGLCTEEMTVGNLDPLIGQLKQSLRFAARLFNNMPPKGYAAEFTTKLAFPQQSVIASVNSEEAFGISLGGPNNPNLDKVFGIFTVFEGVPKFGNGQALLTSPVNCAETAQNPPIVRAKASTYQEPDNFAELILPQPTLVGCDKLEFKGEDPETGEGQVGFSFQPTSTEGSSPVGAVAHLHIDQGGLTDPDRLVTPELKRSVIKLPEGLILNPSSANGLEACSEAQIGYRGKDFAMPNPIRFTKAQPQCPDGSKLGTAEVETPLLDNPLVGEVFLAAQEENPFGSLLAVYLVVNDPLTGVIIKLPGEVQSDPVTGRLTAIFDHNPQLPFEDLTLKFRGGGPRSEFATSEVCGDYSTEGTWTPWSAPESGPPAQTNDTVSISGNCSPSAAARPFAPSFEAGTTGTKAGAYSPLVIKVARKDGEQELESLDFTLPKGLIGKLAGIPYCSEGAIAAAEGKSGKAERANPSCPEASRIGSVGTAAGVGSEPFHVGGNLYLAGPYKGAAFSAVVVTPALAGPLDLGNVVIRSPLYIDPESAQLTAKSDPIPTILKGIQLKLRTVTINVDRPGFMLNPTSCEPKSVSASLGGSSGATATPSNRFQVGGCSDLGFAPKLKLSLKGGTKRNKYPALTAVLTQPSGQANIGKVSVALPHSEFLEQGHIRTICTRVQFAAQSCPAGAVYGHAEALTPLLDQPLKGPVYMRSSSHKLPDLVVALKGPASQPIEITLAGRIDSINGGIRNSFEMVPDAPVSKFVLRMQGGKKGLLVNSTDLCRRKHRATVKMEGQNGKLFNSSPELKVKCGTRKRR